MYVKEMYLDENKREKEQKRGGVMESYMRWVGVIKKMRESQVEV